MDEPSYLNQYRILTTKPPSSGKRKDCNLKAVKGLSMGCRRRKTVWEY
jgi:hypothetical protein